MVSWQGFLTAVAMSFASASLCGKLPLYAQIPLPAIDQSKSNQTRIDIDMGQIEPGNSAVRVSAIETAELQLVTQLDPPDYLYQDDAPDAPGALADELEEARVRESLPDFFYDTEEYNTWGVGVRPIADYAPPGYEHRDYQDAPGMPELSRLTPPPLPEAGDAGKVVTRGIVPGSFLVPGVNTSFRLRGFVRLAALYDFDPIGVPDAFVTNSIPVPQQSGQNFNMSGRISRFAIESWTPTDYRDWNVHTFIEGDFFNGPGQAAGGGGNPFRLRHAFFDFGYFRFGQQNSVFMDGTNWPSLVDFQGPNSWINQRQPSARITLPVRDGVYWATSVERPFSDIATNGLGTNVQDVPDVASHLRFESYVGHLQAGTVMRGIGYRETAGDTTRQMGIGVSGSAVFHPWAIWMGTDPVRDPCPSGLTRSRVLLMTAWGPGVGRYLNDLSGQGLDGQVDPLTGSFDLVESLGWNASYEHWFNERWLTNYTFGYVNVDNNADQPAATYETSTYVAGSLWWIPVTRMSFGIEYLWGERENLSGQSADAQRLHALFQYNF
jgi:hypothetical protein